MTEAGTGPDAIARSIADQEAGGTLADLRAREDVGRRAVDTWITSYMGALANPRNQDALAPPYTVKEVAAVLNCSPTTVREMVIEGRLSKLPGLGSAIRIPRESVQRLLSPLSM